MTKLTALLYRDKISYRRFRYNEIVHISSNSFAFYYRALSNRYHFRM